MGNNHSAQAAALADGPRGEEVLSKLLHENGRFVEGRNRKHGDVPIKRYNLATKGQHPVAAVIACADSRVAPELLFRAGLGELFVIRTAGNTTWGPEVEGSLEYAVDHLNVPLVMVLGHTKCGAVGAACAGGDPLPGMLGEHITAITKGLEANGGVTSEVDVAVERNVRGCIASLRKNPTGNVPLAEKRGVVLCGAVYDITTGRVTVLDRPDLKEEKESRNAKEENEKKSKLVNVDREKSVEEVGEKRDKGKQEVVASAVSVGA